MFTIQQKRRYLKTITFFTNNELDKVKKRSIYKAALKAVRANTW